MLLVSLLAARLLLDALVGQGWPIAVYAAISVLIGYGPSLWWCRFASRRWGTGSAATDLGLRWSVTDLGWGPVVWLACIGCQLAAVLVVELFDIPLVSNVEDISELDLDRTYVISLLVTAVVAAPFVEEMVFRGLMLRGLLSRLPVVAAVGVQAAVFGLAHVDPVRGTGNIGLALVLAAVGVALGGSAYLFRRIGPAIIAHAILNGSCWRSCCSTRTCPERARLAAELLASRPSYRRTTRQRCRPSGPRTCSTRPRRGSVPGVGSGLSRVSDGAHTARPDTVNAWRCPDATTRTSAPATAAVKAARRPAGISQPSVGSPPTGWCTKTATGRSTSHARRQPGVVLRRAEQVGVDADQPPSVELDGRSGRRPTSRVNARRRRGRSSSSP